LTHYFDLLQCFINGFKPRPKFFEELSYPHDPISLFTQLIPLIRSLLCLKNSTKIRRKNF